MASSLHSLIFKRVLFFLILVTCLASDINAQWQPCKGPFGGTINKVFTSGKVVFAGTNIGLFSSTDEGKTWTKDPGITDCIFDIVTNGTDVILGTTAGIYSSSDNGITWAKKNNGLANTTVMCLGAGGGKLFAGTTTTIFYSSDNGASWSPFGQSQKKAQTIVVDGNNVYAGTTANGVNVTSDNGGTWSPLSANFSGSLLMINCLIVSGTEIIAGTGGGILYSPDGGKQWQVRNTGLNSLPTYALMMDGNNFYASSQAGISVSHDKGLNWSPKNMGLGFPYVRSLAKNLNTFFAGTTGGGVFASANKGDTWFPATNGIMALQFNRNSICSAGNLIFAGSVGAVYVSNNNGETWMVKTKGIPPGMNITALHAVGDKLFAASSADGIFMSPDNGNSWVARNADITGKSIECIGSDGPRLYIGTATGVYLSTDEGFRWTYITGGSPTSQVPAKSIIANGNTIITATSGNGILASFDAGASWAPKNKGISELFITEILSLGKEILAFAQGGNTYVSSDNGDNWTLVGQKPVTAVVADGPNIIAGTPSSGVFLSKDKGVTWTDISTGLGIKSMVSFTKSGGNLFATTNRGVIFKMMLSGTANLSGTVFKANGDTLKQGKVTMFKFNAINSTLYKVSTQLINPKGGYLFASVPYGGYVVLVKPDSIFYPEGISTYSGNVPSWSAAKPILINEDFVFDVRLKELLKPKGGKGRIFGLIKEGNSFAYHKTTGAGSPLKGILVSCIDNTTLDTVGNYLTDENGYYEFGNLPEGNYQVIPDITGIPVDSIKNDFTITSTDTLVKNVNFTADSTQISLNSTVGVREIHSEKHFSVYPNPSTGVFYVASEDALIEEKLTISNMSGQEIYNCVIIPGQVQNIDVSFLSKGMYFLKLRDQQRIVTRKLIIN